MGSDRTPSALDDTTADPNAATVSGEPELRLDASELARGASLGRYLVLARLGRGGMGVVYSAYDPELDRKLAIKLLRPTAHGSVAQDDARTRLLREAQAMARLSHPNVIPVHDVGTIDDQVFVVMELVEGVTLKAWLAAEPRSWRASLERFAQAGRGLAAAHAAGLVHRDFKPDNVMIGGDGRVRVLDFGLARAAHDVEPPSGDGAPESSSLEGGLLSSQLTQTGTFLGTPRYMSPEQWRHEPAGPRADQFSFCAALYEAWYRQPPFPGDSIAELGMAVLEHRLVPPPPSDVPARLRAAIERGLCLDPADRHPSMSALLDELAHDPRTARRRALAVGALVGAIATGALVVRIASAPPSLPCPDARPQLAGIWDGARKHAVQAAFAATGLPFQAAAWRGVEQTLDRHADAWVAMHGDNCRATRVRGEQSAELLDLRMACLARDRDALAAQVDVLARADATTIQHAVDAAQALDRLEACADVTSLKAILPLPVEPERRRRIAATRTQLAQVGALDRTGQYAEARAKAAPTVDEARALGYAPLLAEALYRRAAIEQRLGDAKVAEATLNEAVLATEAAGDRSLGARAWINLVSIATDAHRFDDAEGYARHAKALLAAGDHERERSALALELGNLASARGQNEEALAHLREALAIRERLLGPDDVAVAVAADNLGLALVALGRIEEGLAMHRRGLAIVERAYGGEHPDVATSLSNVAIALHTLGHDDEALALERRALGIQERALGPKHPLVASTHAFIGDVLIAQHHLADARAEYQQALDIDQASLGEDHPELAYELLGLAEVELGLDEPTPALRHAERALVLREQHPGPPSELADARFAVARALLASHGDVARAVALATSARAGFAADPARGDDLATVETWLAQHPR
ncbi:MAG: tetratricopeptide repeat protein [Proteobacteria bacterium]|nr:tetratricopeptide repeat protein [Pseudomonadota bacterium]